MTETIQEIAKEIDGSIGPEQIEVQIDPETGKFVEFHRNCIEKVA